MTNNNAPKSSGYCGRCEGLVYHDGKQWRHTENHRPLDGCPTSDLSADEVLARRLVQTALLMKRQYQDAGLIVAREFCKAKALEFDAIEKTMRDAVGGDAA